MTGPQGACIETACSRTSESVSRAVACSRTVVENTVIGRIAFEGIKKVKDEELSRGILQSKPRGTVYASHGPGPDATHRRNYRRSGRFMTPAVNPDRNRESRTTASIRFTISNRRAEKPRQISRVRPATEPITSILCSRIIHQRRHDRNLLSLLGGGDVYDRTGSKPIASDSPPFT